MTANVTNSDGLLRDYSSETKVLWAVKHKKSICKDKNRQHSFSFLYKLLTIV